MKIVASFFTIVLLALLQATMTAASTCTGGCDTAKSQCYAGCARISVLYSVCIATCEAQYKVCNAPLCFRSRRYLRASASLKEQTEESKEDLAKDEPVEN